MRNSFLFRVPGYHGMYDFEEIRGMNLDKKRNVAVREVMSQNETRSVGMMSVENILAKFG